MLWNEIRSVWTLNTDWAESNEYLVYIKLSTLTMATDMHLDRIVKSLCFIYCYYHHNHWTWSILLRFFLLTVGEKIEKYFVPHMKKKSMIFWNTTWPVHIFTFHFHQMKFDFVLIQSLARTFFHKICQLLKSFHQNNNIFSENLRNF